MKYAVIFSVLVFTFCSFGQNTFKKRIHLKGSIYSFSRDISEINSNHYILFGNSIDSANSSFVNHLTILHIDSSGTILDRKSYGSSGNYYIPTSDASHFFRRIDSNYYLPKTGVDSLGTIFGVLFKCSPTGDTVWKKSRYAGDSASLFLHDICETSDQSLLLLGRVLTYTSNVNLNPTAQIYLAKYSKNGGLIWEKRINSTSSLHAEEGCVIVEDSVTKNLIVCGRYLTPNVSTGGLFIFDSLGNKISGFSLNYNLGNYLYDVIRTKDGNFVAVGFKQFGQKINDVPTVRPFLVKFAPNGSFIKHNWFDDQGFDCSFTRIQELPSGKLLTLGYQSWGNPYANELNSVSRVTMLDQNTDFLWSKYYDNITDNFNKDQAWGIAITTDKRIIFTSACFDPPDSSTFMLYRTDTLSCNLLFDSCSSITSLGKQIDLESEINVWPNPVLNTCFIELLSYAPNINYNVEITDIVGHILGVYEWKDTKLKIDLSSYHEGLLFLNIYKDRILHVTKKIIK